MAEDQVRKDLLFAGTEFGLFVTLDGGKSWKKLSGGLPTIAVRDLAVQKRENDLVLATFGRGFYILDDYSPLRGLTGETLAKDGVLFPVKDAIMFMEKSPLGTLGSRSKGFQGESYFTAPNPPVGAVFAYFLKDAPKKLRDKRKEAEAELVKAGKPVPYPGTDVLKAEEEEEDPYLVFTVADEEGRTVRELRAAPSKGLHRLVWDLRYPGLDPVEAGDSGNAASGPSSTFALPGIYTVSMALNVGSELKPLAGPVTFKTGTPGIVSLPAADRAELVAFQKKVRGLAHAVNSAGSILRDLETRSGRYRAALKSVTVPTAEVFAAIKKLEGKIAETGRKLNGDDLKQRADKDAEPGLSDRINTIIYEQWLSTSAPTGTQRVNYEIVAEEFGSVLQELKKILAEDVAAVEKLLDKVGAPYTPGRLPDWKS